MEVSIIEFISYIHRLHAYDAFIYQLVSNIAGRNDLLVMIIGLKHGSAAVHKHVFDIVFERESGQLCPMAVDKNRRQGNRVRRQKSV